MKEILNHEYTVTTNSLVVNAFIIYTDGVILQTTTSFIGQQGLFFDLRKCCMKKLICDFILKG